MYGKNNKADTVDSVIDEARQDYAFALRGCEEKVGHYINRIKTAYDREVAELKKELDEWKSNCNFNHEDRKKKQKQIEELRESLKEAIDVACDGCKFSVWKNKKFVKCKRHKNWKCPFGTERWRKALIGDVK